MVENMEIVKDGVVWPDDKKSKVNGKENPAFHGYYTYNYVKAYTFISKVATQMYKKGEWIKAEDCTKSEKKLLKKIIAATENNGFTEFECFTDEDKGLFLYGMSLHTAADIFAHSTKGIKGKDKERENMRKKKLKTLCKDWKRLTHGPKDPKTDKPYPETNFADKTKCLENRWTSAKCVCGKIIATSINNHVIGSKDVFTEIKYDKKCKTAQKYKKSSEKKKYVIYSYGIINLSDYLKPGNNKRLKEVVNNVSDVKVQEVIDKWKK